MSEPLAVIFDVDGVLVDSYHAHWRSWQALAKESGVLFRKEDFTATFGRTSRDIIRTFWPDAKSEQAVNWLDDRKESLFRDDIATNFPHMPGAVDLIDELLEAGFVLAAGSSGPPPNVNLVLDQIQRRDAFTVVVTGRDVTRGKPDPEVFEVAAKRLKVTTEQCAVIEDAPPGIQAARAAGMVAIALLSTGRSAGDFVDTKPDLVATSLQELSSQRIAQAIRNRGNGRIQS